ncbi:hypothetical protein [Paraburkholderia bannensis]|uniref:hypothetical protein n=1 Tax=Paraburkholderia bannensis TaxID=765414 RepID=UPI002AB69B1D|nr:hypothetical protein [Paraburkholderia bannensis]
MVRSMTMRGVRVAVLAAGIAVAAVAGLAAGEAVAVEPGTYVYTEGGNAYGTLTVKGDRFSIETLGANAHTCELDGTVHGQAGTAKGDAGDSEPCRFTVSGSQGRLRIDTGNSDACRQFCGMRARFEGEYRKAPASCTAHAIGARLEHAHGAYAKKQYADARDTLAALIDDCKLFMSWIETDSVRSDLALAHYHLGENAQCLKVLADTRAIQYPDELPPADADSYRSTGNAVLFNEKLCKTAARKQ